MALVALGELGLDEVAAVAAAANFVRVALHQLVEQLAVAPDVARLEQRGADRLVALGVAQALVDRARGMADLQAEVPQQVEHELDDLLAARRLLVGPQEQQIDVGIAAPARRGHSRRSRPRPAARRCWDWRRDRRGRRRSRRSRGSAGPSGTRSRPAPPAVVPERARLLEAAADLGAAGRQRLAQQGEHLRGAAGSPPVGSVLDQLWPRPPPARGDGRSRGGRGSES